MNLVKSNRQESTEQAPPHLQLLSMAAVEFVPLLPDQFTEWYDFAPGTPKAVQMAPAPKAKSKSTKLGAKNAPS